jgi:hypothetical protein
MTMRWRIEVNLEELDQIIDRSTKEGQKLKTAIHAMDGAKRHIFEGTGIDHREGEFHSFTVPGSCRIVT